MRTIRTYADATQANFARSVLEAAGIRTNLTGEHAFGLGPQYAPEGIQLQVPHEDMSRALAILDTQRGFSPLPPNFDPNDDTAPIPTGQTSAIRTFVSQMRCLLYWVATIVGLAVLCFSSYSLVSRVLKGTNLPSTEPILLLIASLILLIVVHIGSKTSNAFRVLPYKSTPLGNLSGTPWEKREQTDSSFKPNP